MITHTARRIFRERYLFQFGRKTRATLRAHRRLRAVRDDLGLHPLRRGPHYRRGETT